MLTLTPTACVFLAWLVVVQGFSLNMKIILASCTLVVFCAFSVFKNQTVGFGVVCFFYLSDRFNVVFHPNEY